MKKNIKMMIIMSLILIGSKQYYELQYELRDQNYVYNDMDESYEDGYFDGYMHRPALEKDDIDYMQGYQDGRKG
jgi:hypothetical protein